MRSRHLILALAAALLLLLTPALAQPGGTVIAWGENGAGESTVPTGLSDVTAVAAGTHHSLALKSDGTVVGWGWNRDGQATAPAGLSGVAAIAAGGIHSLALKSDGTVVAWGNNSSGQATVPAGLSGVAAIAGGDSHSLALKSDGTVVAWGRNGHGEATVPAGLSGVAAIAAGGFHSLALKSDGTVVAWGENVVGQATVPAGLSGVTAIDAGFAHSLALKSDGTVVAWGENFYGQSTVPAAGLSSVTAIAATYFSTLALKSDGTVVGWGDNGHGQTTVPAGLSNVTALAAGGYHVLALQGPPPVTTVYDLVFATTYAQAVQTARLRGVRLAVIENAAEDAAAAQFLRQTGVDHVWIGINDRADEGTYVWTNGVPVAYTNWAAGHPVTSPPEADCGTYLFGIGWTVEPCGTAAGIQFALVEITDAPNDLVFATPGPAAGPGADNLTCLADDGPPFGAYDCRVLAGADARWSSAAVGDLNGDDRDDLVLASLEFGQRVCINNGLGGFDCSDLGSEATKAAYGVDLVDFDLNGTLDIAFANGTHNQANAGAANRMCLSLGNVGPLGAPQFGCVDAFPAVAESRAVRAVDADLNGVPDLIYANDGANNVICVFGGSCVEFPGTAGRSTGIALGDYNVDNLVDVAFSQADAPNQVCLTTATGPTCTALEAAVLGSTGIATGDFDGDANLDLVVSNAAAPGSAQPADRVCTGDGSGAFTCADLAGTARPSTGVAVSDLDRDGTPDLAIAALGVPNQRCLNDGAGVLTCAALAEPAGYSSLSVGVAVGEFGKARPAGGATPTVLASVPSPGQTAAIAGSPDVLVTSPSTGQIFRVKPDGTKTVYSTALANPTGIAAIETFHYVTDEAAGTVNVVGSNGNLGGSQSGYDRPAAVAFQILSSSPGAPAGSNENRTLVLERGSKQVKALPITGSPSVLISGLSDPISIATAPGEHLLVTEADGRLLQFRRDGSPARVRAGAQDVLISGLDRPFGVGTLADGAILVSTADAVLAFDADGANQRTFADVGGSYLTVLDGGQVVLSQPDEDRLVQILADGVGPVAVAPVPSPSEPLTVSAVAPNPTAGRAVVAVAVAAPTDVRAVVYDVLGREVVVAHDGPVAATAEVAVDVAGLAAGTYVLRLTGAGAAVSRTFTVAR